MLARAAMDADTGTPRRRFLSRAAWRNANEYLRMIRVVEHVARQLDPDVELLGATNTGATRSTDSVDIHRAYTEALEALPARLKRRLRRAYTRLCRKTGMRPSSHGAKRRLGVNHRRPEPPITLSQEPV